MKVDKKKKISKKSLKKKIKVCKYLVHKALKYCEQPISNEKLLNEEKLYFYLSLFQNRNMV